MVNSRKQSVNEGNMIKKGRFSRKETVTHMHVALGNTLTVEI